MKISIDKCKIIEYNCIRKNKYTIQHTQYNIHNNIYTKRHTQLSMSNK